MKFKDYVKACNDLLETYPDTGEFEVFYSTDDEGNGYNPVNFTPSQQSLDSEREPQDLGTKNAIVIN